MDGARLARRGGASASRRWFLAGSAAGLGALALGGRSSTTGGMSSRR